MRKLPRSINSTEIPVRRASFSATFLLSSFSDEEEKEEEVNATLDIDVDEVEPLNEPEKKEKNTEKNKEYEGAQSGNWLKNIITKSKQWLEKDLEDDFQDTPH